jgi:hypothetical protein
MPALTSDSDDDSENSMGVIDFSELLNEKYEVGKIVESDPKPTSPTSPTPVAPVARKSDCSEGRGSSDAIEAVAGSTSSEGSEKTRSKVEPMHQTADEEIRSIALRAFEDRVNRGEFDRVDFSDERVGWPRLCGMCRKDIMCPCVEEDKKRTPIYQRTCVRGILSDDTWIADVAFMEFGPVLGVVHFCSQTCRKKWDAYQVRERKLSGKGRPEREYEYDKGRIVLKRLLALWDARHKRS